MGLLVDIEKAEQELGLTREDYFELFEDLKIIVPEELDKLEIAVRDKDLEKLKAAAHSLKGSFLNMRCEEAGELARSLEWIGAGKSDQDPEVFLKDLRLVWSNSKAYVDARH